MTCDMVRGRNQTRYTLSQDMIPLEFHDKLEKDTPPKGPSLQVLSEQISRLFSDLSERLEGLSQNQEHLNDQVLLQGHQEQEGDFIAREPFAYLGAADMNNLYQSCNLSTDNSLFFFSQGLIPLWGLYCFLSLMKQLKPFW
jgi:hypothetical protein